MEAFLHTDFPIDLGTRPSIYLDCKVTKTVFTVHVWLEDLTVGG